MDIDHCDKEVTAEEAGEKKRKECKMKKFVIRFVTGSPWMEEGHLEKAWEIVRRVAGEVVE
ncbi:hypothetical protein HK102_013180, partial [Quaeritorhiza haematococci]